MPEAALYDRDIIAWANEQARLLRAGHLGQLDLEPIAEEIEDVGKSEQRELASRMNDCSSLPLPWHGPVAASRSAPVARHDRATIRMA